MGWTNEYGLILTAWHVVQDNRGQITVDFFSLNHESTRMNATVVATDRTWDLAVLVVKRPSIEMRFPCIALGREKPLLGDKMTVAGYGKGGTPASYREATGVVRAFLAPTAGTPDDIVQMSAKARSGDSGGPLLDADGTLVGVLFGSDRVGAHGTHCERVRKFLKTKVEKKYPKLIQRVLSLDFWWAYPNNPNNPEDRPEFN